MIRTWHLLTGEYPDQPGGVSDYTHRFAIALARAGQSVHVWAPPCVTTPHEPGVTVHRLPGRFDLRSLRIMGAALNAWPEPSRLFVQYVPHAYGLKGMNVPFVRWLGRRRQPLWVMFHEVAFSWLKGQPIRHQVLGGITTFMARCLATYAQRIFVSIPGWRDWLTSHARPVVPIEWLPVPSNLPSRVEESAIAQARREFQTPAGVRVVGHFGTYGEPITRHLTPIIREILKRLAEVQLVLIGRNSREFKQQTFPAEGRIIALGERSAGETIAAIAACDVLLQPFPDGMSCRRTSAMAALAIGKPVVTNVGPLSEPFWVDCGAVVITDCHSPVQTADSVQYLLRDIDSADRIGRRASAMYDRSFSLEHAIAVLLNQQPSLAFGTIPL